MPRRTRSAGWVALTTVLAAALALVACGTANGALRPQPSARQSGPQQPGPQQPATPGSGSQDSGSPRPAPPQGAPVPSPLLTGPLPTGAPTAPGPPTGGVATDVVRSTASGGRSVALTFDDGPGGATGAVLDLLAQYGARATFCLVGQQVRAHPEMVRRILAAGHRLCNHSAGHPQPFAKLSHDQAVRQIEEAERAIVEAGGPGTQVAWFRAPGGGFTADNQRIAADHGLRPLGWSVDPRDWSRPGAAAVVATVQRELRPGGVVLLHDGGGERSQTVEALRQLLPWLAGQGYRFDFPAR
ncbi:polysaccharide deacetylase family protein [Kitasatospora sp. NPDC054939]